MPLTSSRFSRTLADASVVSDRVILYARESRHTVVLNPVGTILWDFLASSRTREELRSHLLILFPTLSSEQAQQDMTAFVDELLQYGLIHPTP